MTALKDRPEDLKDLKQYGLDKPAGGRDARHGRARPSRFELGGEADAGSVWARDPSKAAVFSVNNGVATELKKKVEDFRRKEVFDFRPFNTTRFEITRGKDDARVRARQGHRRERGRHLEAGRAGREDRRLQQPRRRAARFLEPSRRELRGPRGRRDRPQQPGGRHRREVRRRQERRARDVRHGRRQHVRDARRINRAR